MLQILNSQNAPCIPGKLWREFQERTTENRSLSKSENPHETQQNRKSTSKKPVRFRVTPLRPLEYYSTLYFKKKLQFVYCRFPLESQKFNARILLENASFKQVLKPVGTSKLTFSRVIWRSLAKHPLGFRVVLVTTASIHLHILAFTVQQKSGFPSTLFSRYGTARLQAIRSRAVLRFWGKKRGFFAKKAVLLGGSRV